MAILGLGDYRCEACKHFDTDGNDGNHPSCMKQQYSLNNRSIRINEECPFGYEFGIPVCYPVNKERNEKRAYEIKAMIGKHAKKVQANDRLQEGRQEEQEKGC